MSVRIMFVCSVVIVEGSRLTLLRELRSHVQAHLSAEQPTAGKEARFSTQDEDSSRSLDRERPQVQGSQSRECLTQDAAASASDNQFD